MTAPMCTSWLGHRFKARYSLGAAVLPADLKVSIAVDSLASIYERFREVTYIHDICVRCGHVIEPAVSNHPEQMSEAS